MTHMSGASFRKRMGSIVKTSKPNVYAKLQYATPTVTNTTEWLKVLENVIVDKSVLFKMVKSEIPLSTPSRYLLMSKWARFK